jgi:hypothetical protein
MNKRSLQCNSLFFAACLGLAIPAVNAAETSTNEAEINIWVDNASLNLFVSQLAIISGRTPQVDGVLPGIISGRFTGSVEQTLDALSDSYPILFDVDGDVLRAVDKSALSNVSIAMSDSTLGDVFMSELDGDLMPGNSIEFREDSIRVSGHPSFVKRSASRITAEIADTEARTKAATGVDAGSREMINDIQTVKKAEDAVTKEEGGRRPILSVTDIPGYTTF